jgi:hypothetical protein
MIEMKIGGVLLIAESATQRNASEVLMLCGSVGIALVVVMVVEYLQGESR